MKKTTLALDLSTKTGYAVFNSTDTTINLYKYGKITSEANTSLSYPINYIDRANKIADKVELLIAKYHPTDVVIEETNGSKSRYTQKLLEFIHFAVINKILQTKCPIHYINTSDWRKALDVSLSKDDKKNNSKLSKAKSLAKKNSERLDKKKLGIKGRVTKKHASVRVANAKFNLDLKVGENDLADAICVGAAFVVGAPICDGK